MHDVREESGLPISIILINVFGEEWEMYSKAKEVQEALNRLTHIKGTFYSYYIQAVKSNQLATRVKIADLLDNLNPNRLALLEEDTAQFLITRYTKALETLGYNLNKL